MYSGGDNQGGTVDYPPLTMSGAVFLCRKERDKSKMKRWICAGLSLLMVTLLLAGCSGGKGDPLPEGMEWSEVLTQGETVTEQLIRKEYEAVYDQLRDDVRAELSVEDIAAIMDPALEEAGAFEKMSETQARGDNEVEPLGVADILCEFSEEKVRFLIVFDPDMTLTGFSVEVKSSHWSVSNIWDNITGFFK